MGLPLDLNDPRGYNAKLQWLKLYDQMPEHIACCDKIAVREYVAERIGSQYLIDLYAVTNDVDALYRKPPFMAKTSHDSGSARAVLSAADWPEIRQHLRKRFKRAYGVEKGEWAYAHIRPQYLSERLLTLPVTDYKFHCCNGSVKWVQIISEREAVRPVEVNVDRRGLPTGLHLDHKFRCSHEAPKLPANWKEMTGIAKRLSGPFRYVRVDLYSVKGRTYFGELTFWPRAGFYRTDDEMAFGELLDFDMSFKREPVDFAIIH
jgi:hypothetical protein